MKPARESMMEPSQRITTYFFADIQSAGGQRRELVDAVGEPMWRSLFALVREAAAHRGDQEARSVGDGIVMTFGSARQALACALDVQELARGHQRVEGVSGPLEVRIGLHSGEPTHDEEVYFMRPLIVAKSLCKHAEGGRIMVSETFRSVLGAVDGFDLIHRGICRHKDFSQHWHMYEVTPKQDHTAATMASTVVVDRTPFVGREKERAESLRLIERALHGAGSLLMIGGEAGVGKTRFGRELMSEARRRGLLVAAGCCYDTDGVPPYIPFVEALESVVKVVEPDALLEALGDAAPDVAKLTPDLRRLFPGIPVPDKLPPEQERHTLFEGIRQFVERATRVQPVCLVLDDLQWASDSTVSLLQHLAHRVQKMALLIVGIYRDVDLDHTRPLAEALENFVTKRLAHPLVLGGLSESETSALLRGRIGRVPPPRFVRLIHRKTDGNPFFVEEISKHLLETGQLFDAQGQWNTNLETEGPNLPHSIRLAIGNRLDRISEECRRILMEAAVIGHGFSFELLREVTGMEQESLLELVDEAERARLIVSKAEGGRAVLGFSHALIGDTLLGLLSLPRRQRLHLRVAEALERVYPHEPDERVADLAHHFFQAGVAADKEKTAHYLTLAGDSAFQAAAFEDALLFHEQALSLQPPDDERGRAELLYKRGLDLRSMGRLEEGLADWREALAVYERLGDVEAVGRICADLSTYLFSIAHFEAAFEAALQGLAALQDRVNPDRCLLLATAGFLLSNVQEAGFSAAHDLFAQALEMAEQLNAERLRGPVLGRKTFLHHAYWQGREAADVGLEATKLERSHDPYATSYPLAFGGQCGTLWMGRLEEAARIGDDANALATRAGNEHARWFAGHYDSFREVAATGDLVRFEERRAALLEMELALRSGWIILSYVFLARAQFWRGLWEEARASLQRGAEADVRGHTAGMSDSLLFLLAAYEGEKDVALAILERRKDSLPRSGQPNMTASWIMLEAAVEGLAMLDERPGAAALYPLTLEAIATGNLIRASYSGLVQTTAGIAATAGDRWEQAEEHYQAALRQAHEIPYMIEQAEVRRWYARMLSERNRSGDRERARTLLHEAVTMYRHLGMPKHRERSEQMLRPLQDSSGRS